MDAILETLFARMDRPFTAFDPACLGGDFAARLRVTSSLWFRCGYAPGIASYLAFFLMREMIELHDSRVPARFASLRAMAESFHRTDQFIRDVTDSGREPTGGISSPRVRALLAQMMERHRRVAIPEWTMTWFGWTLFEAVERVCAPLTDAERDLHLRYMTTTYRLMGVPFAADRDLMGAFARAAEARHAAEAPQLERHARAILRIGEMIGVSSEPARVTALLPEAARKVFAPLAERVRPGPLRRAWLRLLGRFLVPRAVGRPRIAEPFATVHAAS